MKLPFDFVLVLVLAAAGCASQSKIDARSRSAFLAGRLEALRQQEQEPEPEVFFRGEVRNPTVPWTEGLTLAQGLLAAEHVGKRGPILILIRRGGETIRVNPRQLLWGGQDPLLEAGDVVEIR